VFTTPKKEENLIRSFVNQFCKKYKEPDPSCYNGVYPGSTSWENMDDLSREYCYLHHSSHMYNEKQLMEQIKMNMNDPKIEGALCRYGFYETNYGIGIFILFAGTYEMNAINKMKCYLKNNNIPFANEFSEAKWVYRFLLNIDKDTHAAILNKFR
jgi:hypothetical protein